MSRRTSSTNTGTMRPWCAGCDRARSVCLCAHLPAKALRTATRVVILQHPHETRHRLATVPLLKRCLARCVVLVGRRLQPGSCRLLDALGPSPSPSPDLPNSHRADGGGRACPSCGRETRVLLLFPTPSATELRSWVRQLHDGGQRDCDDCKEDGYGDKKACEGSDGYGDKKDHEGSDRDGAGDGEGRHPDGGMGDGYDDGDKSDGDGQKRDCGKRDGDKIDGDGSKTDCDDDRGDGDGDGKYRDGEKADDGSEGDGEKRNCDEDTRDGDGDEKDRNGGKRDGDGNGDGHSDGDGLPAKCNGREAEHAVLVVMDGTWGHAREMVKASLPFLDSFAEQVCLPFNAAMAGWRKGDSDSALRREPFAGCVTTLEAVARALAVLEPDGARIEAALLAVLRQMVAFQQCPAGEVCFSVENSGS